MDDEPATTLVREAGRVLDYLPVRRRGPRLSGMGASTATAIVEPSDTRRSAEVLALLATMLTRRLGRPCRIRSVDHRPSDARSSFALEEIDVLLDSGEFLRLILKALGPRGIVGNARLAKPLFLHDPLREIEFYRHVLAERPHLGTAMLYSTVVEPSRDRYWLLFERVPGVELSRMDEVDGGLSVARWLARLHPELAPLAADPSAPGLTRLLLYDGDFLRMWIARAHAFVRHDPSVPRHLRLGMERLVSRYERVVERLTGLPRTIVHGEFCGSNVLVQRGWPLPRICAVDWEMVAIGPQLIDVAALVAGERSEEQRRALALTYRSALPNSDPARADPGEFLEDLAYCRLHLAVQWLGRSPDSSPPVHRPHDWIGDALRLADELDL